MTDGAVRQGRRAQVVSRALNGRYTVRGEIGRGGMSTVFVAHDALLDREVAVKVFSSRATTPEEVRAQETEARLVAALNHHALATLYDAGVDTFDEAGAQIFLVMEYVRGTDLKRRLQDGPVPPLQVGYLGFDLSEALEYVHENGFVHRDVKPANVLLADRRAGSRLRGKLADFGIASIAGQATGDEYVTGTAAYLSPEQVDGEDATPASDVYSLGLVLLEAATARTAFPGDVESSAFARLDRDPEVPASVPEWLGSILLAMCARNPADRPTLRWIADAFGDALVDQIGRMRTEQAGRARRAPDADPYHVLDAPPAEAFDTVVRLAVRLLRVPAAVVCIVDRDRVWTAARAGDDSVVDRDADHAFVIGAGSGPWVVPDTTADPRIRSHPLIAGPPFVRSFAAAPLATVDGHPFGAIAALDRAPRRFDADDLAALDDLAGVVMRELELRLASRRAVLGAR